MRIDRLHVENFLGVRSVDLPLEGPVSLIAGPNGSGKSSLKDAISYCALGETARAPKMKKRDFSDLLHPGSKRGHATLQIDGVTYSRGSPTGNFSTASLDPPKGWEVLLDPAAFLRLGLEERRKELFRVLGVAMDSGLILAKLVERGYDEPFLVRIRSFLREGFAIAATEAQGIARERKGEWRHVAGEDWGEKKGAAWFATVEEAPSDDLPALRLQVAKLEGQSAGIDGQIGVVRQRSARERKARDEADRARQEAERVKGRIVELRTALTGEDSAKAEREAGATAVEEAERAWNEAQAAAAPAGAFTYTCGSCGRTAVLVRHRVVTGALVEYEDNERADARIKVVQAKRVLADADRQLESFDRTRALLEELEAMRGDRPEQLAPFEPEAVDNLLTLEAKRQTLATELQAAREAVQRVQNHQERVIIAKERTADAAALHTEIETWLRLAEDLGPEGIPAQLLHSAIDPINEVLARSGKALGFVSLALTPEMELVGRPEENDPETPRRYELLSESARWRCEAAVAHAIGSRLDTPGTDQGAMPIVLDRFDVLDGVGRSKAIRWLLSLKRQSIVLGTLRHRDIPSVVPDGLVIYWLSAGTVATE